MISEFRLPDLGEGLPEAEIVQWHVSEGDTVTLNQTIAEVETAKAIVEIPSPYAGIVQGLHAAAGDIVEVGSPLVSFAVEGADAESPAPTERTRVDGGGTRTGTGPADRLAESRADGPSSDLEERRVADDVRTTAAGETGRATPNLVGYGAAPTSGSRPRRRARGAGTVALDTDHAVREAAPHDIVRTGPIDLPLERPRSTPPVRKFAKDHGIDLALVAAAHPGELITRVHVEEYAEQVASAPPATPPAGVPASGGDRVTRTPIRGVRKYTAAAMVQSAFTAPHATTFLTLDVTATTELLASLKTDRALDGHKIGLLAIVAKAVCLALGRTPALNARWDEAAGEIIEHHYVNLGIAAATDRGLVVPVIADADRLDLVDLADAIADLATTARAGRTTPAAMTGGTFSITNVGVFGVDAGTPILNPGEAGILAVGALRTTPWEHQGEIALRDVLTLSLSFDHRLVDGAEAARFLTDVAGVLREPGRAMLLR
ncbi:pyruvate dehydrogenase E2 component (dihydrolipoamide acetyltransferase) [Microbacterium sp. 1154]|uniref:dihydrolipoamide acetyltransferase family protein n=1 Tax=Microbacterium sp. 1154 TaxID=2817733 RepID=UPI002854A735|nr:dihydrolipoamide acetyltransferase family protein [Microbacterium sp. 1154]MDR6692361.1 pyruvate dehydrogenase E2 component (dihydrolipoamide acetyltransferase) [Microbacterium sp. 1154]